MNWAVNDVRFGMRQWARRPGFALVTVAMLALAIGANTAIFSVIQAVLLKPLPYPEPERLVTVWERSPERGIEQERVSGPNYLEWRRQNTVFSELSVSPGWEGSETFNLVLPDSTRKVRASYASASLFQTLGVKPLLGRTLLPEEDLKEGTRAAVLGFALWQREFAGDSNVLGQKLTLDTYGRRDYTIVGVMPQGFGLPSSCQLWLPMGWMGVTLDERRSAHWHNVIARLKKGVTLEYARREMNTIQSRLRQEYPGETVDSEVAIVPLLDQALGRNLRRALIILWGAVTGVLLIACANVANLMLVRATTRQKEIALRLALGAGRWRVMRQLLTESVMLALAGGALGLALSWWGLKFFISISPSNIPRLNETSLDLLTLGFTLATATFTGLLFGLAPAWRLSKSEINEALKDEARGVSRGVGTGRTRDFLVVTEVALSMVLLAAAGLMLQSFARILRADRGFEPAHLLAAELDFSVSGFTTWVRPTATRPQVPLQQLIERLRSMPGVEAVGAASRQIRYENRPPGNVFSVFGRANLRPEEMPRAEFKGVTPFWARAQGARILRGRDLTETDSLNAPGAVLINETLAKRYFPNEDPLGQRLRMGDQRPALNATNVWGLSEWSTIVGIVSDVKSLHPEPQAIAEIYQSYWQWPMQSPVLLLRARGEANAWAAVVRRETKALLPMLPSPTIRTMDDLVSDVLAPARLETQLISLFAALALLLAALGLYAVLAYTVTLRTHEIGVRLALGAQRHNIVSTIVGKGMKLALLGVVLGAILALALTRLAQNQLYGFDAANPMAFAVACAVMSLAALLACLIPAYRAMKVNPIQALHHE
jgi:putative ABC transport system permease protein